MGGLGLSDETAAALATDEGIVWHQQLQLSENVMSPGKNPIEVLTGKTGVWTEAGLAGKSVLDVGTCNGGAAFMAEHLGAGRVVAVDIYPVEFFGFDRLHEALSSKVTYVQTSVYELPEVLGEQFDIVAFFGVLYHLRHPLLALDALRSVTRDKIFIESEVNSSCEHGGVPYANFYRRDELNGDSSNWFVPSLQCLEDWLVSSGFVVEETHQWLAELQGRVLVNARRAEGDQEYRHISYEVPLRVEATISLW